MTTDQLLSIPPAELDLLSDEELALKLQPLIPLVRTPYVGRREHTVHLSPDAVISSRAVNQKLEQLKTLLKAQGQIWPS